MAGRSGRLRLTIVGLTIFASTILATIGAA
jgi:hypothetical protein